MTSYVRLADEKEVYAVDGFLNASFNRQLKDYRDSRILRLQKNNLHEIEFKRPGQSFSLSNNDSIWRIDGMTADSPSVADYLSELSLVKSTDFIDDEPENTPDYTITFTDKNGSELAVVNAFYTDSANIVLGSSINPGNRFDGAKSGLFSKLFKEKNNLLGTQE